MATAKQLAALKKARAARKRNLAMKGKKKAVTTKKPTKKRPVRKAVKRVKKSPRKTGYLLAVTKNSKPIGYWDGDEFWSQKSKGKRYTALAGVKKAATAAKKKIDQSKYGLAAIVLKE